MSAITSTPVNTINRDNLTVLIRNNVMNESVEFASDCDKMDTDSPIRKPGSLQLIIKKLFHSPIEGSSPTKPTLSDTHRRKSLKRKLRRQRLIPDSDEKIKMAYVRECDDYSPDAYAGMRKRVLISLFHNKEYSMECSN